MFFGKRNIRDFFLFHLAGQGCRNGSALTFDEEGRFAVVEKAFQKGDQILVRFEMKVIPSFWYRDTMAVES